MAYTLISFIGTGMYKTESNFEGYKETDYDFGGGKHYRTRLFMQALLECKYKEINQVILLGTDTSSWDCLVDKENDDRDETLFLWSDLFDQCETKGANGEPCGVSSENLNRLERYLLERLAVEVHIRIHTHNITGGRVEELFVCYTDVTGLVKKENDILFDITHGFRSMPILLYQSLQYMLSQTSQHSVELVYGELAVIDKSKGIARDLSQYWNYSELTVALNVFKTKLDGSRLAGFVAPQWEKGSKAIKRFSEIVQTNFSLQIVEVLKQLRNALKEFPQAAPAWLVHVKEQLKDIVNQVEAEKIPRVLYNYSRFLYAHQLNVQAVIALQVTVESCIVEKYGNFAEHLGDYAWWRDVGHNKLSDIKHKNKKELSSQLTNLEVFRNQIAHGGGKNKDGNFPQAANIPHIYKSGLRGVENLFKTLGV